MKAAEGVLTAGKAGGLAGNVGLMGMVGVLVEDGVEGTSVGNNISVGIEVRVGITAVGVGCDWDDLFPAGKNINNKNRPMADKIRKIEVKSKYEVPLAGWSKLAR